MDKKIQAQPSKDQHILTEVIVVIQFGLRKAFDIVLVGICFFKNWFWPGSQSEL